MLSVFVVNTGRRVDYVEAVVDIDKDIDHGFLINGSYTHDRFLRFDPIGYQEALEIQAWSSPSQDSTRLSMTATPVGNPGSSVESTCTFNQVINSSDDDGDYDFLWVFQGFLIMASLGVCACGLLLFNSSLRKRKISDAYTGDPDTISAEVFAEGFKRSRSELRSYDSEEIARSNRALDSGLLDSVIQDIEGLPNSLRHESRADTERSEKELDEILKDLID